MALSAAAVSQKSTNHLYYLKLWLFLAIQFALTKGNVHILSASFYPSSIKQRDFSK